MIIEKEGRSHEEDLDRMSKIYSGHFIEIFKEAEKVSEGKASVSDYHNLYVWCLTRLIYIIAQNIELSAKGVLEHTSYNKEMSSYKELKKRLDETFNEFAGKIESTDKKMNEYLYKLERMISNNNRQELLPELEVLNKLTEGKAPVLRKWEGGKYKCSSLERFTIAYIKIADNLTPALIRDYLISERFNKPYSKDSIETVLKNYGPADRKIIRS